jgi:hypothetical protein
MKRDLTLEWAQCGRVGKAQVRKEPASNSNFFILKNHIEITSSGKLNIKVFEFAKLF